MSEGIIQGQVKLQFRRDDNPRDFTERGFDADGLQDRESFAHGRSESEFEHGTHGHQFRNRKSSAHVQNGHSKQVRETRRRSWRRRRKNKATEKGEKKGKKMILLHASIP